MNMADEQVKELMISWAQNTGYQIPLSEWQSLWKNIKSFKSTAYKENCHKMFYRWYIIPAQLAKMYNCSNSYWKCMNNIGTFYHMW